MAPDGHEAGTLAPLPDADISPAPQPTSEHAIALALARHAEAARVAPTPPTLSAPCGPTPPSSPAGAPPPGLGSLPATPDTVAAFIDAMAAAKAPATVRRYVASVAAMHRAARLPNPCAEDAVRLALKRLHRARGRAQAQAAPLTRDRVDRMLEAAGDGPRALRNRRSAGRSL